MLEVTLHQQEYGKVGSLWDVSFRGEVIVSGSRDPEHDAARALFARGLTGRMVTLDEKTGAHRMYLTIERAADLRTSALTAGGIGVKKYVPFEERQAA